MFLLKGTFIEVKSANFSLSCSMHCVNIQIKLKTLIHNTIISKPKLKLSKMK